MESVNNLYLTSEDLKKLKQIGHGTDGTVYQYNQDLLVKLYHERPKLNGNACLYEDHDIKIYNRNEKIADNYYKNFLNYYAYTDESIKLLPKEAIKKAIDKQKNISLTALPLGVVYVDGKFAGCVLKRHRGIEIHKLIGVMPLSIRKKLFLQILRANAELLKNNIYHHDLANSPYRKKNVTLGDGSTITCGHSHVLYNPLNHDVNIIDLDGISTVYTETFEDKYYTINATNLNILALEFLFKIDYEEHKEYLEEILPELGDYRMSLSDAEKLINLEATDEDLYKLTRKL
jgi:hypothetical protein